MRTLRLTKQKTCENHVCSDVETVIWVTFPFCCLLVWNFTGCRYGLYSKVWTDDLCDRFSWTCWTTATQYCHILALAKKQNLHLSNVTSLSHQSTPESSFLLVNHPISPHINHTFLKCLKKRGSHMEIDFLWLTVTFQLFVQIFVTFDMKRDASVSNVAKHRCINIHTGPHAGLIQSRCYNSHKIYNFFKTSKINWKSEGHWQWQLIAFMYLIYRTHTQCWKALWNLL